MRQLKPEPRFSRSSGWKEELTVRDTDADNINSEDRMVDAK
jgi:hypothetical protein